jgi:Protein of unknown function (DUF2846)
MRFLLLVLLSATTAFAQYRYDPAAAAAQAARDASAAKFASTACGPKSTSFTVTQDDATHPAAQPAAGQALVYFIKDDGPLGDNQHYTLRIGLDGGWVGAYKQNSYFTLSVQPGEHHVCASVQSNTSTGLILSLAHFSAEPGQTYYFRTRFIAGINTLYPAAPHLDITQPDSDEAKYLLASYPLSVFRAKK